MRQLTELAETDRVRALERFALVQAHLEQGVALSSVAKASAVPLRTARRWIKLYRTHGLAGLARRGRTDRGERRSVSHEGIAIVEGLALQRPLLSVAAIHRELALWAVKAGHSVPSHDTVRRIVEGISPALTVSAEKGRRPTGTAGTRRRRRSRRDPLNHRRKLAPGRQSAMAYHDGCGGSAGALVERADRADRDLYRAKDAGRNTFAASKF